MTHTLNIYIYYRMNKKILLLFIIFFSLQSSAQKVGRVLHIDTRSPIVGVNIYLYPKKGIAITDTLGQFDTEALSHLNNTDTIYFSCIGYKTKATQLTDLIKNQYIVLLNETSTLIKEVTINARPLQNLLQYTQHAPLPNNGIYSFASCITDSCLFVIGGDYTDIKMDKVPTSPSQLEKLHNFIIEGYSKNAYKYDIAKEQWTKLKLEFLPRAYHSAFYYNDKIYILGGKRLSQNKKLEYLDGIVEIYDTKRNKIIVDKTNPHPAINFASFIYKDNPIVMGGSIKQLSENKRIYTNKVHLFNLKTGYWYELNRMPESKESKGIIIGNLIYLFGGFKDMPLDNIESYDIHSGAWKRIGHLPFAVNRPGIVCVDKTVYIFENGRIQTYNLETQTSSVYKIDLQLTGSELFYKNNKLYILGGCRFESYDIREPSSQLYSIDLSEFAKTSPL